MGIPDFDPALGSAHITASGEALYDRVSRQRARWLKRVMYDDQVTSSQKCLAYAISDHLNCVTLDCWPSQERLAKLLKFESTKTIQRTARGLASAGFIVIRRSNGRAVYRYAPIFIPSDGDKLVPTGRRPSPLQADNLVRESLLVIQPRPVPTAAVAATTRPAMQRRGTYELAIAEMLGSDGMEILSRLSMLDDAHVERLCQAHESGALGPRELAAARLAAQQIK